MNTLEIDNLDRILRDIRLEASVAMRNMREEDPLRSSFAYISDLSTKAISHIEK